MILELTDQELDEWLAINGMGWYIHAPARQKCEALYFTLKEDK